MVGNAGNQIIDMSSEIYELSYFLMEKVKSPLVFPAAYLVNQVLQTVTKIKVNECRLISQPMRKSTALTRNAGEDFGTKALDFQKKTPHLIGSFLQNETSRLLLIFQCSCFQKFRERDEIDASI